jgi:hypothetical protein
MPIARTSRLAVLLAALLASSTQLGCDALLPEDANSIRGTWTVTAVNGIPLAGRPYTVAGTGWQVLSATLHFQGKQSGGVVAEWFLRNEAGVPQPGQNGAGDFTYDGENPGELTVRAYDQELEGQVELAVEAPAVSASDVIKIGGYVRIKGEDYALSLTLHRCLTTNC